MRFGITMLTVLGLLAAGAQATAGVERAAPAVQPGSRTVWDGVYSEEQADRGEGLYTEVCLACHLSEAGGEMAPALSGSAFLAGWNGVMLGELFDRVRSTMPLDDPGSLTRSENAEILAYMLRINGFPAGESDLANRTEFLNLILLDSFGSPQ